MEQWVEDEIILPSGPFGGERYRHERHPVSRHWFRALDSGLWSRFSATGPTQCGKTLMCYVAPVLYQLFEMRESVIVGLPNMDMANVKWSRDFLPVIKSSRYRNLLPLRGEGSRGGKVKSAIEFQNGASLRFMTGGGDDKQRAGDTAKVLAVTETDGMDEAGRTSREADKIEQLEGRTRAFGRKGKRVYLECTVSIEAGRIWQEVKQRGTDSRLLRPCPHCHAYVAPEREHLVGWENADNAEAAAAGAFWSCPECGEAWTEEQRRAAAASAVLVHRGQEVTPTGEVTGKLPLTDTFGFRWSAIDNPFASAADLGAEEWQARRSRDQENIEKKMKQFVWCLPVEPPEISLTPIDPLEVQKRTSAVKRGLVPEGAIAVVVGIDTGMHKLHWEAKAVLPNGSRPVIDYGQQAVDSKTLGVFRGLVSAFGKLAEYIEQGWSGMRPAQVWIDAHWYGHTDAIYAICEQMNKGLAAGNERYRPMIGYGEKQRNIGRYYGPAQNNPDVLHVGRQFYIARLRRKGRLVPGVILVHCNADHWKSETHQRLAMPVDEPGAIALFDVADQNEHHDYCQMIAAERLVLNDKGEMHFEPLSRNNHHLDTAYIACCAAEFVLEMQDGKTVGRRIPPPGERLSLSAMARRGA